MPLDSQLAGISGYLVRLSHPQICVDVWLAFEHGRACIPVLAYALHCPNLALLDLLWGLLGDLGRFALVQTTSPAFKRKIRKGGPAATNLRNESAPSSPQGLEPQLCSKRVIPSVLIPQPPKTAGVFQKQAHGRKPIDGRLSAKPPRPPPQQAVEAHLHPNAAASDSADATAGPAPNAAACSSYAQCQSLKLNGCTANAISNAPGLPVTFSTAPELDLSGTRHAPPGRTLRTPENSLVSFPAPTRQATYQLAAKPQVELPRHSARALTARQSNTQRWAHIAQQPGSTAESGYQKAHQRSCCSPLRVSTSAPGLHQASWSCSPLASETTGSQPQRSCSPVHSTAIVQRVLDQEEYGRRRSRSAGSGQHLQPPCGHIVPSRWLTTCQASAALLRRYGVLEGVSVATGAGIPIGHGATTRLVQLGEPQPAECGAVASGLTRATVSSNDNARPTAHAGVANAVATGGTTNVSPLTTDGATQPAPLPDGTPPRGTEEAAACAHSHSHAAEMAPLFFPGPLEPRGGPPERPHALQALTQHGSASAQLISVQHVRQLLSMTRRSPSPSNGTPVDTPALAEATLLQQQPALSEQPLPPDNSCRAPLAAQQQLPAGEQGTCGHSMHTVQHATSHVSGDALVNTLHTPKRTACTPWEMPIRDMSRALPAIDMLPLSIAESKVAGAAASLDFISCHPGQAAADRQDAVEALCALTELCPRPCKPPTPHPNTKPAPDLATDDSPQGPPAKPLVTTQTADAMPAPASSPPTACTHVHLLPPPGSPMRQRPQMPARPKLTVLTAYGLLGVHPACGQIVHVVEGPAEEACQTWHALWPPAALSATDDDTSRPSFLRLLALCTIVVHRCDRPFCTCSVVATTGGRCCARRAEPCRHVCKALF
jgi:hypothetical protein